MTFGIMQLRLHDQGMLSLKPLWIRRQMQLCPLRHLNSQSTEFASPPVFLDSVVSWV